MIDNNYLNKKIREIIKPSLKNMGFNTFKGRNSWMHTNNYISVINLKSVGNYFSQVTGWPTLSLTVMVGIFYLDLNNKYEINKNKDDLLLPKENECHLRGILNIGQEQSKYVNVLKSDSERNRTNIWWIDNSGQNIDSALNDIKDCLQFEALEWINRVTSDIEYTKNIKQGMTFDSIYGEYSKNNLTTAST